MTAALKQLHAANAKGDDAQVAGAREKIDQLMEKQQPEFDTEVQITEGAVENAQDALKLLNVRQTHNFLLTLEVIDPTELLLSALDQVREIKDQKEQETEINAVADEVGWLLHGFDDEDAKPIVERVTALLQKAAKQKNQAAAAREKRAWEKEADLITSQADNMEVLGNVLEHGMAELLSNPRLESALRQYHRPAKPPAPPKKNPPGKAG
jgi:hypothetical protein